MARKRANFAFGGPDTRTEGSASECKAIACERRAANLRALERFWECFPVIPTPRGFPTL